MRCESCGREFPGSAGDTCPWCGHVHGGGGPSPWQTPQAQATGPRSSGGSAGIPWENEQSAQSLFETMKGVLLSPADTFASAAPMVGLAPGFLFAMILGVAGGVLNTVWQFALGRGTEALGNLPENLQQFGPVIQAFTEPSWTTLIVLPVTLVVGLFVGAAILHVCLLIVGGANGRFEDTFRAVAYAQGAVAVMQIIPFMGPVIGAIWAIVIEIFAIKALHQTTYGKAVFAVLLPVLVLSVCCCCGAGAMVGALGDRFGDFGQ